MATFTFKQFLGQHGITMFMLSLADTVPGNLVQKKKRGYFPVGHLKNFVTGSWTTELVDGNLVSGSVERSLSLTGKSSLNEFGVKIAGGLSKASKVTFKISGVKARKLKNLSELQIASLIDNLKATDKSQWRRIKKLKVAILTVYASEFTADFEVEGGVNLKGDLSDKITLGGGGEIKWINKSKLKISANDQVPFGFTSLKI